MIGLFSGGGRRTTSARKSGAAGGGEPHADPEGEGESDAQQAEHEQPVGEVPPIEL